MKSKIINFLWKWSNSNINKKVEEDFSEFLKEYKKRQTEIKEVYHPKNDEELKGVALAFSTSYTQKQMALATDSLKNATWILALATIAFTLSQLIGPNQTLTLISQLIVVLLWIIVIFIGISFVINIVKFIVRFFISKQAHVWCSKCGRIVSEYESEGDAKPAITLCPDCLKKRIK